MSSSGFGKIIKNNNNLETGDCKLNKQIIKSNSKYNESSHFVALTFIPFIYYLFIVMIFSALNIQCYNLEVVIESSVRQHSEVNDENEG